MGKYGFNEEEIVKTRTTMIDKDGFHRETASVLHKGLTYVYPSDGESNYTTFVFSIGNDFNFDHNNIFMYFGDAIDESEFETSLNNNTISVISNSNTQIITPDSTVITRINSNEALLRVVISDSNMPENTEDVQKNLAIFYIATDPTTNEDTVALYQIHEV